MDYIEEQKSKIQSNQLDPNTPKYKDTPSTIAKYPGIASILNPSCITVTLNTVAKIIASEDAIE
jgi:hypothetical protein